MAPRPLEQPIHSGTRAPALPGGPASRDR